MTKGTNVSLHDNLILHGDNLLALKALLPTHAGRISCVYIDPPYNTGNEGWCYNDNVANPMIKEWLGKAVDREDLTRHDKWLCMMYPRLTLLHELLAEDGVIFVSIDDNEVHRLRMLMDEIFGEENFVSDFIVRSNPRGSQSSKHVAIEHERLLFYCKNEQNLVVRGYEKTEQDESEYNLFDPKRGKYRLLGLRQRGGAWRREERPNLFYPFYVNPESAAVATTPKHGFTQEVLPKRPSGEEGRWTWGKQEAEMHQGLLVGKPIKRTGGTEWDIFRKDFLFDETEKKATKKVRSLWSEKELNYQNAGNELKNLFDSQVFEYPKPVFLIKKILKMFDWETFSVLDSFAGSGTTAHAVMALNKEDGGNRKFILVECEKYANEITAERVRRIIKGVPNAKDENLRAGFGGGFSYWELGDPIQMENILNRGALPSYAELARYVFYTATGEEWNPAKMDESRNYIGDSRLYEVYLLYKPDINFLKKSALTLEMAKNLRRPSPNDKTRIVFAPVRYVDGDVLHNHGIKYCQLPFEIYKMTEGK